MLICHMESRGQTYVLSIIGLACVLLATGLQAQAALLHGNGVCCAWPFILLGDCHSILSGIPGLATEVVVFCLSCICYNRDTTAPDATADPLALQTTLYVQMAAEAPAYVVYGTMKQLFPTLCFTLPQAASPSCMAAQPHLMRLCACVPQPAAEVLTTSITSLDDEETSLQMEESADSSTEEKKEPGPI